MEEQGNGGKIFMIIVIVALVGIVGYLFYNNQQQQMQMEEQQKMVEQQNQETQDAIDMQKKQMEQAQMERDEQMEQKEETIANLSCEQRLTNATAQLELLTAHAEELEKLKKQIDRSPDFAIETCRSLNPGLSKPECETKIATYVEGGEVEYEETQDLITETEEEIEELEKECPSETATN